MRRYSVDLRERVAKAYLEDKLGSLPEVARIFGVGRTFVTTTIKLKRTTGSVVGRPHAGGREPILNPSDEQKVVQWVKEKPDRTLPELCQLVQERLGKKVSTPVMSRVLARQGLSRKKKPSCGRRGYH